MSQPQGLFLTNAYQGNKLPRSTHSTPRRQRNIHVRRRSNWGPPVQKLGIHGKDSSLPIQNHRQVLCDARTTSSFLRISPNRPNLPFRTAPAESSSRCSARCTTYSEFWASLSSFHRPWRTSSTYEPPICTIGRSGCWSGHKFPSVVARAFETPPSWPLQTPWSTLTLSGTHSWYQDSPSGLSGAKRLDVHLPSPGQPPMSTFETRTPTVSSSPPRGLSPTKLCACLQVS